MEAVGILTIVMIAIIALFTGFTLYFILFHIVLPAFLTGFERSLPGSNLPPQFYESYYSLKNISLQLVNAMPFIILLAVALYLITRSARREEDVI